jgi:hypothetical protein
MKERLVYSPKNQRISNQLDINFKKSPQKFVMYEAPQTPPQLPPAESQSYYPSSTNFDSMKRVSD